MSGPYFCCHLDCPGYPWKASEARHPCGATPDPDPYTRAQELREGAEPTPREAFVLTRHLQGHEPGHSWAWQVAAHLSRAQIRAILTR